MSAMTHNEEKDGYRNNSLTANYGKVLSNNLDFKSSLRISETNKQYDKEITSASTTHNEEEDGVQASGNISLEFVALL